MLLILLVLYGNVGRRIPPSISMNGTILHNPDFVVEEDFASFAPKIAIRSAFTKLSSFDIYI
jgi:hypothetical protein